MRRFQLLWPAIIVLSTVAAGLVIFVTTDTVVRPFIVLWFLFVCPGMALVRLLRLKEPVVEGILALALSFAVDAIVAGILLYAGEWSPAGTLEILMGISLGGALLQIALASPIGLIWRTRVSTKTGRVMLSATKHLWAQRARPFAALRVTRHARSCSLKFIIVGPPLAGILPGGQVTRHSPIKSTLMGHHIVNKEFIPVPIQPLIDAYLHALEPLRSHFFGIYIFGSIAFGAFEELESDIDLIALTQREWTTQELAQLNAVHTQMMRSHHLGKRLEVLYIPLRNLGKVNGRVAPYPNFHSEKFSPAGYGDLNYVTWWNLKTRGICLLGPGRSALPLEVTWQDVLETMRDNLDSYWASNARRPYLFLLDGWIVIAVATLCRILTTIEEEEIITKSVALKRWRNRLPARWCPLIDEAWRIRHHLHVPSLYSSRFKRMRETLAFIEYVRERGGKVLKATSQR